MWITKSRKILALAPMADYTDSPFCQLCREVSGQDFVIFREMVSAEAIVRGNQKTLDMCGFVKKEHPIVIQLFGAVPQVLVRAASLIMEKYSPDGIDINMGCPVPKVTGKNLSGAALMKDHERAVNIVCALKKADLGVPISVKTRLGWSKKEEILEFAPKLEAAGADLISIHGRTKNQGYAGEADWQMIDLAKKKVSIPVLANGDIKTREDIERCLKITGADGVMIGRGALGNPGILGKNSQFPIPNSQLQKVIMRHCDLHLQQYGEKGIVTLRKHLPWYFKGMTGAGELRARLVQIKSKKELEEILAKI